MMIFDHVNARGLTVENMSTFMLRNRYTILHHFLNKADSHSEVCCRLQDMIRPVRRELVTRASRAITEDWDHAHS